MSSPALCLQARFPNPPLAEIQNACREQQKITELRILKLLGGAGETATAGPMQHSMGLWSEHALHVLVLRLSSKARSRGG